MSVAVSTGRQGANQVDVDVGKTAVRDGNGGGSEMDMAVNLGALAGEAFTGPSGDVLGEGLPNKTGGDEAAGGTAARMRDIVEQGEHGAAEGGGDQGTESASGDVAMKQKQQVLNRNCGELETGEVQKRRNAGAGGLELSHLMIGEGRGGRHRERGGGDSGDDVIILIPRGRGG